MPKRKGEGKRRRKKNRFKRKNDDGTFDLASPRERKRRTFIGVVDATIDQIERSIVRRKM